MKAFNVSLQYFAIDPCQRHILSRYMRYGLVAACTAKLVDFLIKQDLAPIPIDPFVVNRMKLLFHLFEGGLIQVFIVYGVTVILLNRAELAIH